MRSRFAARTCSLTATADGATIDYAYDGIDRLAGESKSDTNGVPVRSAAYIYDDCGNRICNSLSEDGVTEEYANSFEAGDRLAGWSRADSGFGPDSVTNTVYLYAASGCTTNVLERYVDGTERRVSYTWTDDYRLASVSVDGEPVAEYAYDVLGNLVAVANDEESFEILVDNGHSLADVAADGRTLRVYMRAPGVDNWLGFVDMTGNSPVPYFYVTDHLGSVLAVTDANGNLVERYEYDAWGKVLSVVDGNGQTLSRSAIGNRILWQGREYSWTTGLYYFRNRWYDPTIGRWISKDPIGIQGGINLYAFCGNDPVYGIDPFGLWGIWFGSCHVGNSEPWAIFDRSWLDGLKDDLKRGAAATADGVLTAVTVNGLLGTFNPNLFDSYYDACDSDTKISHALGSYSVGVLSFAFGIPRGFTSGSSQVVTHWGPAGMTGLRSGDWVMTGGASFRNWVMAGAKTSRKGWETSITVTVPKASLRYPSGWTECRKGLIGQRIYVP